MTTRREHSIIFWVPSNALIAMSLILLLVLLKICLNNHVYYKGRQTNLFERLSPTLKKENVLLRMRVEKPKHKRQITNTIFTLYDDTTSETPAEWALE